MTERHELIAAIEAAPDDDLPKLVYADWLDEHGEEDEATRWRQYGAARRWLQEIAAENDRHIASVKEEWGPDEYSESYYPNLNYETLIQRGVEAIREYEYDSDEGRKWGSYFSCGANQHMQDYLMNAGNEFWEVVSILSGVPLPKGFIETAGFTCSC